MQAATRDLLPGITYYPMGFQNGVYTYVNRDSGVANGYSTWTMSVKLAPTSKNPEALHHVQHKLTVPIVATATTEFERIGDVTSRCWADVHLAIDPRSTPAQRADMYNRVVALVSSPEFEAAVKNLEPVI